MSASFGYNQSKSQQESKSQSGLRGGYADQLSPYLFNTSREATELASRYSKTPFGTFEGRPVSAQDGSGLIQVNNMGLPIETTQALTGIANQYFSKASAGGSFRGQNTPENTEGIVGGALQNLGSFLLPYILQTKQYFTELPDKLMSNRLGFLQNTVASSAPLLGSQSSYTGSSNAFGFDVGGKYGGSTVTDNVAH